MKIGLRRQRMLGKTVTYAILAIASIVILFPFYWMLRSSVMSNQDMLRMPIMYLPKRITLANYSYLLTKVPFPRWFANSVIISVATTIISVVIATFAGYSFARFHFPRKRHIMLTVLTANMVPRILIVIPYYVLLASLGMIDTYQGLIISYVAFCLPFTTWMLAGYFKSIPAELEESAMVDGCTRVEALFRIILPLSLPGIAASAIYCFILGWSEFMMALSLTNNELMRPLAVGLAMFVDQFSAEWGLLMAGSVMVTIPVLIMFLFLQRYLIQGLTAGAVKG